MNTVSWTLIGFLVIATVIAQRGRQPPPSGPPPFLAGAPQSVLTDFKRLVASLESMTDVQAEQTFEAWIRRQSPKIQGSYQQFKQQMQASMQQNEAKHRAKVARLSPQARTADSQLSAIQKNPSLTQSARDAQTRQIFESLPQNVKQELQQAFKPPR